MSRVSSLWLEVNELQTILPSNSNSNEQITALHLFEFSITKIQPRATSLCNKRCQNVPLSAVKWSSNLGNTQCMYTLLWYYISLQLRIHTN